MFLVHLDNGKTIKLNPHVESDLCWLDNSINQKEVRRVALLDEHGRRVDLPLNKNGIYRMWIERVIKNDEIKGERFCMRTHRIFIRVTLYYSDNRIVFDVDQFGGFIDGRR